MLPFPVAVIIRTTMGYFLKLSESLEIGVSNIAQEQIDLALGALENPDLDLGARVHIMRRCCKRLRALLRLVEPGLGKKYRREDRALRDAGRVLSQFRDSDVALSVHRGLRAEGAARGALLTRWESRTNSQLRELYANPAGLHQLEVYALGLEQVWSRIGTWRLKGKSSRILAAGIGKTYGRARRDMNRARRLQTVDIFHDWRKQVKYHRYHVRLLRLAWPNVIQARAETADELGECLGKANDLAMYLALVRKEPLNPGELAALEGEVRRRQAALYEQAWLMGDRLFHQPAETFGDDLAYLWRIAKRHHNK